MVSRYLVECFWPSATPRALSEAIERLSVATSGDEPARAIDVIFVPEDEIVLCVCDGVSPSAVHASTQRAGFPATRVVACEQLGSAASREMPPIRSYRDVEVRS